MKQEQCHELIKDTKNLTKFASLKPRPVDIMSVTVKIVQNRRDLRKFVDFPNRLYKGNEFYVPGLFMDEMDTLDPKKNPAYEFSSAELYLAYKDGELVGRVAAIINTKANESWKHDEVRYGWFDFIDDKEVSGALIDAVVAYGKKHGMTSIAGPLGFTDFDPEGMLVEGYDQIGTFPLIYNYPYYVKHMEDMGFEKVVDWLEYKIFFTDEIPARIERVSRIVLEKYGVRVRKVTRREVRKEQIGRKIFDLINRTYCNLFDFTILTDKLVDKYVDTYLGLLDLEFVTIIEDREGKIVGMGITMPSIVHAMQKCRGRLFPFGWYHLLKSMYFKYEEAIELLLIAVEPEWMNRGLNALLIRDMIPRASKRGFVYAETNAELENNSNVQSQWSDFRTEQHKRRRVYGKKI